MPRARFVAEQEPRWEKSPRLALSAERIRALFDLLNAELAAADVHGELHVVGGAVMCLAHGARESTADVDALMRPASAVRRAAARVATSAGLPALWLNDAVKGFLGASAEFDPYLELSHLRIFVARPQYLLAMKAVAMRLEAGVRDLEDVRFLIRMLDLSSVEEVLAIVEQYFAADVIPVKTRLVLEELLPAVGE